MKKLIGPVWLLVAGVALSACTGQSSDPGALSGATVGGQVTGSGADVLRPAAPCGGDGSYLWSEAAQGVVRSYRRVVDGVPEDVVVGAWPMREAAARDASERIDYGEDCPASGVTIEPAPGGPDRPGRSIQVRTRDEPGGTLTSWAVRQYTYESGHIVVAWIRTDGPRPSYDAAEDLLDEQIEAL